jgi:tripartite-type tricarboxylate transporter receptor subunit TctC
MTSAVTVMLAAFIALQPLVGSAADFPVRPIRMIVANAPGSTSDIFGRLAFNRMSEILGQQIVVDNRPGAGGVIGADVASRAFPDGYTLGAFTAAVLTIAPHVQKKSHITRWTVLRRYRFLCGPRPHFA